MQHEMPTTGHNVLVVESFPTNDQIPHKTTFIIKWNKNNVCCIPTACNIESQVMLNVIKSILRDLYILNYATDLTTFRTIQMIVKRVKSK